MRSTCNRSLWIILLLISTQCVLVTKQEFLKVQQRETEHLKQIQQQQQQQKIKEVKEQQLEFVQTVKQRPADIASKWSTEQQENSELILKQKLKVSLQNENRSTKQENVLPSIDDNNEKLFNLQQQQQQHEYKKQLNKTECAKSSLQTTKTTRTNSYTYSEISKSANSHTTIENNNKSINNNNKNNNNNNISTLKSYYIQHDSHNSTPAVSKIAGKKDVKLLKESFLAVDDIDADADFTQTHKLESIGNNNRKTLLPITTKTTTTNKRDKNVATKKYYNNNKRILHVAYSNRHRMLRDRLTSKIYKNRKNHKDNILTHKKFKGSFKHFAKRETAVQRNDVELNLKKNRENMNNKKVPKKSPTLNEQKSKITTTTSNNNNQQNQTPFDERNSPYTSTLDIWSVPFDWSPTQNKQLLKPKEPIIIIDDIEEFDSGTMNNIPSMSAVHNRSEDYSHLDQQLEPRASPLRPLIADPFENNEEISVVYADQHTEIRLMCEVDLDIASSTWYKNGQVVHAIDRTSRATDYRFIKEPNGALTITNVMLEDDGKWQCEAENTRRYAESARPVKLVVLDRPKAPYLLIDGRRLDAGNIFVPVKENSELNLACVSEGGNPKPTLSWEVLLSPGIDRHTQKVAAEVLELQEIKNEKDASGHKSNGGSKSEARLPAVYRAHHNARILCVMEHPTLKVRQNASLLLDVQYTPSFAISRTPGFGYPLREGIEVSLKCDVDSNPPSTPHWQKDDGETPVPQNGDGFLNFTSIRREHSGWYKCTSRHLNFQYSSIGYYLSVRFDSVEVTSEPDDQDVSVAAASHNPKQGQLEVQLGGTVTLQCPQGSLGCWSHLDPVTARLRGLGQGLSMPTGQFSIKDVVYQDAGTYKCVGQSPTNKKKFEVLQTVGVAVKGAPTVVARDAAPVAYPGSPLHLAVEFCANPPAHAARWLHGDRVFTPGNQYGSSVLAYAVMDLPTPFCKEARLTYVSMHERVERIFYFIVSTPGGVAEAMFKVNFTKRFRKLSNSVEDDGEKLSEPEEIHFPVFGVKSAATATLTTATSFGLGIIYTGHLLLYFLLNLFHY